MLRHYWGMADVSISYCHNIRTFYSSIVMGQNAIAGGGTLANMPAQRAPTVYGSPLAAWGARGRAYLPGARERHGILTLYPGKSDFPTKIRYYRASNAAINLLPSSFPWWCALWNEFYEAQASQKIIYGKKFWKIQESHYACPWAWAITAWAIKDFIALRLA